MGDGAVLSDIDNIGCLIFPGKRFKQLAPAAELLLAQAFGHAADAAFSAVSSGFSLIQTHELSCAVSVKLLLGNGCGYPTEKRLIRRVFRRRVGQIVPAAWSPTVRKIQPCSKLINQPVIDPAARLCNGDSRLLRIGQKQITVSAAAVEQIRPGKLAGREQLIDIVLHDQVQEEGAAAKRSKRVGGSDGVDKLLDAGEIRGIEQIYLLLSEGVLMQQQLISVIDNPLLQQIFTDAGADSRRDFQMVKK